MQNAELKKKLHSILPMFHSSSILSLEKYESKTLILIDKETLEI